MLSRTCYICALVIINLFDYCWTSSVPSIALCSNVQQADYFLNSTGFNSSLSVTFNTANGNNSVENIGPCKLQVTAPFTHIVSVSFVTAQTPNETEWKNYLKNTNYSCMLSIYLPENRRKAFWKVDPCREPLPPPRLVTHQLRVVWNPPPDGALIPEYLTRTQLVLTAVGQGGFCERKTQHVCISIGFKPSMCIANELLCDGIAHCPRGAGESQSDENRTMCQSRNLNRHNQWEYIAHELIKKLSTRTQKPHNFPLGSLENNKWIHRNSVILQHFNASTTLNSVLTRDEINLRTRNNVKNVQFIDPILANYGPWGYLMLGMLLCGLILMTCGLWECFCRRHKRVVRPPSNIMRHSLQTQVAMPTTTPSAVIILNSPVIDELSSNSDPPSYDDLDQPPKYGDLFPELKRHSIEINVFSINENIMLNELGPQHRDSSTEMTTAEREHLNNSESMSPVPSSSTDQAESSTQSNLSETGECSSSKTVI